MKQRAVFFIVFWMCCADLSAQLFPFDEEFPTPADSGLLIGNQLLILDFREQLAFFGDEPYQVEVYFEPTEKLPPLHKGFAFRTRCTGKTYLVGYLTSKNSFQILGALNGRYRLFFYRPGSPAAGVEIEHDVIPDEPGSRSVSVWGNLSQFIKLKKL
jgi:hypothetical protein